MNSRHPKDKIRDLDEEWGKLIGTFSDTAKEYQEFKLFYTKRLRTLYADTYKPTNTGHSAEELWKFSELDNRVDQLEYLQSEVASDTQTTISVPSNQPTETSSLEIITSTISNWTNLKRNVFLLVVSKLISLLLSYDFSTRKLVFYTLSTRFSLVLKTNNGQHLRWWQRSPPPTPPMLPPP